MAQPRSQLQSILKNLAGEGWKVYFQPPEDLKIEYPCIIYKRDYAKKEFAGDATYLNTKRYMITVIDRNPDSEVPDKVAKLPLCSFNRAFSTAALNHDVFTLFF